MNIIPVQNEPSLILLADDDKFMRLQLRRVMELEGYQVAEASDGEECLAIYPSLNPDIVLLDVQMPRIDGFTCCRQLQKISGDEQTPVLMITGLDDQESVDRAFAAGATDYITKPIHWAVLRHRVRRIIQQRKLYQVILKQAILYQQLQEANLASQRLANTDALTLVANRRRFDECLDQEWRRLVREQAPLSLILCDIDFFKAYNDTYGHQAGDYCLQQVAKAIAQCVQRPADLVARYGGEEFAVILPFTESSGAVCVAENIRCRVKALEMDHANSPLGKKVTLSLGVASTIPSLESCPEALISNADKSLYQAKQLGRDRAISYFSHSSKYCDRIIRNS